MARVTLEEMFDNVAERMVAERPEIARGRIFSSSGLSTSEKYFAIPRKGELLLKLPAERVEELIANGAGQPFQSGGRTMREWVCVAVAGEAECAAYMEEARAFVASLRN